MPRHEPTLIATARSQMTASSPRGTFSQAELTAELVIPAVSPGQMPVPGATSRAAPGDLERLPAPASPSTRQICSTAAGLNDPGGIVMTRARRHRPQGCCPRAELTISPGRSSGSAPSPVYLELIARPRIRRFRCVKRIG